MSTTSRKFTRHASEEIKKVISTLKDGQKMPTYKASMFKLGLDLGSKVILSRPRGRYFYIVCTAEDADYLAKGIMQTLSFHNKTFNIACFWNQREQLVERIGKISPAIRKYIEDPQNERTTMVVVKSLISGGCVVKTNTQEIIERINPSKIIITAPIISKDAKSKLKEEF